MIEFFNYVTNVKAQSHIQIRFDNPTIKMVKEVVEGNMNVAVIM